MPKIISNNNISPGGLLWLRQRELGLNCRLGHSDWFFKSLYSSMQPVTSWDDGKNLSNAMHGGVFNLEFSPDGSLLVAACEKKSILMFDPLSRRLIKAIDNAHSDCVNCVKFLDQRMFATCSDDSTVALWDARNLKQRIRTLAGHSDWVKNIEYSAKDGLLLTSGFDGSIYTWDINSFSENNCLYKQVFHTNGLMRTRLTPDASKMLICTTSGYLIIIHNLKLNTLAEDFAGFKPNMYRLMQLSQTTIPAAANFSHLFSTNKRYNRVEFLTDFPNGDDAEVISSLQVHPQGWCALSRNVSSGEKSEWTCIHDIQEREEDTTDLMDDDCSTETTATSTTTTSSSPQNRSSSQRNNHHHRHYHSHQRHQDNSSTNDTSGTNSRRLRSHSQMQRFNLANRRGGISGEAGGGGGGEEGEGGGDETSVDDTRRNPSNRNDEQENNRNNQRHLHQTNQNGQLIRQYRNVYRQYRNAVDNVNFSTANVSLHVSSADVWEALVALREARSRRERDRDLFALNIGNDWLIRRSNNHTGIIHDNNTTVVILGDRNTTTTTATTATINSNSNISHNSSNNSNNNSTSSTSSSSSSTSTTTSSNNQNRTNQNQQPVYTIPRNYKIHQNISRLTHYIQEPNVGSGYIKELCFSPDGRIICSPFAYGIRLLAFSKECQELSHCVPALNQSVQLEEILSSTSHSDIVLSTKFSPRHCLLVSGCLSGKIVWHQPVV